MKKIYTLLATALLICASTTVNAKSWRINSNVKAKADFTSVAEAIASEKVVDDDELYLEPGHVEEEDLTITKKLHLIGPGYWNELASSNISYANSAKLFNVVMQKTGSGSSITGCVIGKITLPYGEVDVKDITFERCLIIYGISWYEQNDITNSSWNVINCYITDKVTLPVSSQFIGNIIIVTSNGYDILRTGVGTTINNNTIIGMGIPDYNKVIISGNDISQCTFKNNIIINREPSSDAMSLRTETGTIASNNIICSKTSIVGFLDNIYSPYKLEDLFKMTGNEEEIYELKENSPAKGKGTHGTDCGAYGGERPYVKGGYPQLIPVIYDVTVPNHPTDGKLPVQLKIRTQND